MIINGQKCIEKNLRKIKKIFGAELLHINHIGSTSVPGMVAKPIVDILVEVQDIKNIDSFNSDMKKFGYTPRGENGIPGRRYFIKGDHKRTHHIHIYQTGAEAITKHLAFRDYLIENQNEVQAYSKLKQELSREYPDNVKLYQEKKSSFVNELTEKALIWAARNN